MNGIDGKRPADAVAGINTPALASVKRPKKSAEISEDQQDASWSTVMTPELIGTAARFLDLGTPSRPDLTNLFLAVGRDTSRVVRKMYLAGNEWYISHLCRVAYENEKHRKQAGMESWLEYNPDWRNRSIGAKSEKNVYSFTLEPSVAQELGFGRSGSNWVLEESFACSDTPEDIPSGLAFGIGDALLSVGGFDVAGMKCVDFFNLLESDKVIQDDKIVLKYLPASIRLFSDPLMATRYDLLAPLKHLVETGAVGVNEAFGSNDEKENLIWFTLKPSNCSNTCECFMYLLSVEGIDVNIENCEGDRLIHLCSLSNDGFDPEALRLLVDSRDRTGVDLNAQDNYGWTAIHCILSSLDTSDHKTKMSKLKLLLEAGADPNLSDEDGETPEQYLLRVVTSQRRTRKESEVDEAIGMLRRYTLMREAE